MKKRKCNNINTLIAKRFKNWKWNIRKMVARLIKCQNGPLFSNNEISIKIASGKIEISNAH